ncbi:hypothetical protein [Cupriavidus necator]
MQAPEQVAASRPDEDDNTPVIVVEICTARGVHFHDAPRPLECVILADYIKRNGSIPASMLQDVQSDLATETIDILEDEGLLMVMDRLLYDDGDYLVLDAGEGPITFCLENDTVYQATPRDLN